MYTYHSIITLHNNKHNNNKTHTSRGDEEETETRWALLNKNKYFILYDTTRTTTHQQTLQYIHITNTVLLTHTTDKHHKTTQTGTCHFSVFLFSFIIIFQYINN